MATDWSAGLDQDELAEFPSASSPLKGMGIDPDEANANPGLLSQLRAQSQGKPDPQQAAANATVPPPPPQSTTPPPDKASPSAATAGKIGGAGDAPATPSTAPAEPTDADSYGRQGLGMLSSEMKKASAAGDEISTDQPADVARLAAQRDKLAMPAPRFDSSGKQLTSTQVYDPDSQQMVTIDPKASTGTKVWRGIRGGLEGLAGGGVLGALKGTLSPEKEGSTAYNAPSKAYTQAEDRREQALQSTDTDLKNSFQTWKDVNDARKAKAGEHRATAALGKDLTAGATALETAENKPQTEQQKADAKVQLDQKTFDQRRQQLSSDPSLSALRPLQKALYMANGKIPDPRETTEGDVQAANMARALTVWKGSHGGQSPATVEDFNQVIASAKGDLNKGTGRGQPTTQQLRTISDKKAAGIEKANQDYAKVSGKTWDKTGLANYQRQLQEVQNAYEEEMGDIGQAGEHNVVTVDAKGQAKWTPESAAAPAVNPAVPKPPVSAPQQNQPPSKPQPAPDGTRRQTPKGTVEVKRGGQWVAE